MYLKQFNNDSIAQRYPEFKVKLNEEVLEQLNDKSRILEDIVRRRTQIIGHIPRREGLQQ